MSINMGDKKINRISVWLLFILLANISQVFAYQNASSLTGKACYKSVSTEESEIKRNAKIEWSNDYSMQLYEIKQQKSAYRKLCSSPIPFTGKKGRAYEQIRQDAWDDWYPDFSMIVYTYETQTKDYESLQKPIPFTGKKGRAYKQIRQDAWDDWYPDFSMILYIYDRQTKDYDSLHSR